METHIIWAIICAVLIGIGLFFSFRVYPTLQITIIKELQLIEFILLIKYLPTYMLKWNLTMES